MRDAYNRTGYRYYPTRHRHSNGKPLRHPMRATSRNGSVRYRPFDTSVTSKDDCIRKVINIALRHHPRRVIDSYNQFLLDTNPLERIGQLHDVKRTLGLYGASSGITARQCDHINDANNRIDFHINRQ